MKKTILTTLAIAMTVNSVAFAQAQTQEQQPMNQKQVDRVLKVAAMTEKERRIYRYTVLDEVKSYKNGLELMKVKLKNANEIRDEKEMTTLIAAITSLSTGAVAYFSHHRVTKVKAGAAGTIKSLTALIAGAAAAVGTGSGARTIKETFSINQLESQIEKSIEEIGLLETELQAIQDLSPKLD